jgi:glycosyltransferase involved in cell wall biosynthesis
VVQEVLDDGLPASRATVIYNGIDPVRLSAGEAKALRAALGIPPRDVVLAAVGSLIPRKGVDVLLAALALLRQRGPSNYRHHLLVVGEGPERPTLQALAVSLGVEKATHFLGERADVGAVLRDATDIAVSASRQETLGLSLLEAALCGLPVVATAIPPHREAVLDQETGLLVPPEAPEPLARAIQVLSDDVDRRHRLGAAGQRRVQEEFLVDRYVARIQEAYESLLARPARVYGWFGEWCWPSVYWRWSAGWVGRRVRGLFTGGRAGTGRREGS